MSLAEHTHQCPQHPLPPTFSCAFKNTTSTTLPTINPVELNPLHEVKKADILEEEQLGRYKFRKLGSEKVVLCSIVLEEELLPCFIVGRRPEDRRLVLNSNGNTFAYIQGRTTVSETKMGIPLQPRQDNGRPNSVLVMCPVDPFLENQCNS